MASKVCQLCGLNKPLEDYHKNKQIKDGKHTICKNCNLQKSKRWRIENPEKAKTLNYRKKYNLTYEQVGELKSSCGYKCEICGIEEAKSPRGNLFVDHCHETGEVRGILCLNCNNLLGSAKDNLEVLLNAIKYLKPIAKEEK
jgi:hypothetical protein